MDSKKIKEWMDFAPAFDPSNVVFVDRSGPDGGWGEAIAALKGQREEDRSPSGWWFLSFADTEHRGACFVPGSTFGDAFLAANVQKLNPEEAWARVTARMAKAKVGA